MKNHLLEDEELLDLLKHNNCAAFKEIYVRYWKQLYLIAFEKLRRKEIAKELTQDIFVSLWERRQENNILNLKHYLFKAIKYKIINHIRTVVTHQKYEEYMAGILDEKEYTTEEAVFFNELSQSIESSVSLLPVKTKEIFRLSREENYPVKEIAKTLNVSEKVVEYHITQALKTLKLHLKDYLTIFIVTIFSL
jgi:RNA polymerase sigma-70 factor (ECF subfamily)